MPGSWCGAYGGVCKRVCMAYVGLIMQVKLFGPSWGQGGLASSLKDKANLSSQFSATLMSTRRDASAPVSLRCNIPWPGRRRHMC